jgi:hypothetical protein
MPTVRALTRVLGLLALLAGGPDEGHANTCPRAEFEKVVDQASATLVELTQKNTPLFQAKLRQLKDKRGWSTEQLVREGAPFVRDETIQKYDEAAQTLLQRINNPDGSAADCATLAGLRGALKELIETQTAKWTYMLGKVDKALAE